MFGITAFSQAPFSSLGESTFNVDISESIQVSHAQTCIGTFVAVRAETVNLLDTPDDEWITFAANSESASFDSTVAVQAVFDGQIDEDVQFNAIVVSGVQTAFASRSESVNVDNAQTSQVDFIRTVSESSRFNNLQTAQADFSADIDEDTQFDAAQTTQVDFVATQAETARLLDSPTAVANFIVALQEQASFFDSNFARFLWVLIDDPQNADWQNINSNTSPGWGVIDTDEPGSWQVIDTV